MMHPALKHAVVAFTIMVFASAAGVTAAQSPALPAGPIPAGPDPPTLPDTIARDSRPLEPCVHRQGKPVPQVLGVRIARSISASKT